MRACLSDTVCRSKKCQIKEYVGIPNYFYKQNEHLNSPNYRLPIYSNKLHKTLYCIRSQKSNARIQHHSVCDNFFLGEPTCVVTGAKYISNTYFKGLLWSFFIVHPRIILKWLWTWIHVNVLETKSIRNRNHLIPQSWNYAADI